MQEERSALIVGAGIGGLAAGIALRRAGLQVRIYERAPVLQEVGAGLTLWANAIRALDALKLGDTVRAQSHPEMTAGFRTPDGRSLMTLSTAALSRRPGETSVALHRADLQAILLDAFGDGIHLDAACTGFEQDADGVTARFEDGRAARADLLVGADGLHSAVRTALHGRRSPAYAGYTAWRAVIPFAPARLTPGETMGAGARFGQVPLGDGRVYWFATKNAPEGARSPDGEKAALVRTFGAWHAPIPDLIAATDERDIGRNDIYDRPVLRRWGAGRVTLLGDAAHPMTPNLGQGACQALEDAVALGEALQVHTDVPAALRAYEAARTARANGLVRESRRVGAVAQWQHPAAIRLRAFLLRHLAPRLLPRQFERMVGAAP